MAANEAPCSRASSRVIGIHISELRQNDVVNCYRLSVALLVIRSGIRHEIFNEIAKKRRMLKRIENKSTKCIGDGSIR